VGLAAAAIVVVALGAWHYWPAGARSRLAAKASAEEILDAIRHQHLACVAAGGLKHHDESLSRDLVVVADRLGDRLHLPVLVPDLARYEFDFVGADQCGIQGHPAAHVLYHSPVKDFLSVFSAERLAGITGCGERRFKNHKYVISRDNSACVVAWEENDHTYAVCARGGTPEAELLELVDSSVRVAVIPSTGEQLAWLAPIPRP
jgi:anti-sigma factor RsiW